jgi:hypothetical protein
LNRIMVASRAFSIPSLHYGMTLPANAITTSRSGR